MWRADVLLSKAQSALAALQSVTTRQLCVRCGHAPTVLASHTASIPALLNKPIAVNRPFSCPSSLCTRPRKQLCSAPWSRVFRLIRLRQAVSGHPPHTCVSVVFERLQAVTTPARSYFTATLSSQDDAHMCLASSSGDQDKLRAVYMLLQGCSTIVQFAQLVFAALRERPQLCGVLPVPHSVLRHCFSLGLRSGDEGVKVALEVGGRHLALTADRHLSRESREALELQYARLHGLGGAWRKALAIVQKSHAVRYSVKSDFACFVRQSSLLRRASLAGCKSEPCALLASPSDVARAVAIAPSWCAALEVMRATCLGDTPADAAILAFIKRADCLSKLDWRQRLLAFTALPPSQQSFRALRPLLEAAPQHDVQFIVVASKALRASASRMYAGKVTQRVSFLCRQGRWELAIALCCAAGYYDVALPLTKHLGKCVDGDEHGSELAAGHVVTALPHELHLFASTAARLGYVAGSVPTTQLSSTMTFMVDYSTLSLSELLAHALYGDWRCVATDGAARALSDPRLRSLLSARLRAEDGDDGLGEVHCYTFQSSEISRLVCESTDSRARAYFLRVIPRYLHAHHCSAAVLAATMSPRRLVAERVASYVQTYHHSATAVVRTKNDCRTMMAEMSFYLRHASHLVDTVSGVSSARRDGVAIVTEEMLLRELARVLAHGHVVQLMPSDRYSLSLELLRAGDRLGLRLDASVVALLIDTIVPAPRLVSCTAALAAAINALNLLGCWRRAWQLGSDYLRRSDDGAAGTGDSTASRRLHHDHDTDNLHERLAQVAFYAPLPTAKNVIHALLRHQKSAAHPPRRPFARILADLLRHDTRELRGRLRRLTADAARAGSVGSVPRDAAAPRRAQERRALLGAAFRLLNEQKALQPVVLAAAKTRIGAEDVDEHGMQRLTRVLPWHDALAALEQLWVAGGTVESHWLALLIARAASPSGGAVGWRVARWRQYSSQLNCLALCSEAIAEGDAALACKALVRYCRLSELLAQPCYLLPLVLLLRQFCESEAVVERLLHAFAGDAAVGGTSEAVARKGCHPWLRQPAAMWMRQLYNLLIQDPALTPLLKPQRHWVTLSLHQPRNVDFAAQPLAAVLIAGHIHCILARHLQWPVAASFFSRLLRLASTHGSDWKSALFMFSSLRRPTLAERASLVVALRECDTAAATLMSSQRFLRAVPEQVVVWTHDALGKDKWRVSLRMLHAAQDRLEPPAAHSEAAAAAHSAPSTDVLEEVRTMVSSWAAADCTRALVLLRRAGLTPERSAHEVARDGAEGHVHAVLAILLAQEQRCAERER